MAPTTFFGRTYDEALALLREARDYIALGGERADRDGLAIDRRLMLARESMRVTARLGHVMAWLLLQKAVHAGELTRRDAATAPHRLGGQPVCLDDREELSAGLPERLKSLSRRSHALYVRVARLDELARRDSE